MCNIIVLIFGYSNTVLDLSFLYYIKKKIIFYIYGIIDVFDYNGL